ncbi:MAG: HlyD family type I secretion periplasmic adaptor subunit [Desulfobulbaceae bacterium]|jgi:HlyD family type I secretion membrane fusion protein|nr:HlyD family type I secretion periplasmic adaptor subunit [Desulfobulbaceae bacterium]
MAQEKIQFTDSRRIIAWGLLLIATLFIGGIIWMALARITGTVVAPGSVKIATERQVVQHLEGGIVKQILVHNGDKVKKGQPLVVMESAGVNASVQMLRSRQYGLWLTAARLQAEKSRADHIVWPPELINTEGKYLSPDIEFLLDSEQKIFTTRRKALADNVAFFKNQMEQFNEVIDSLRERIHFKELIMASLNEELQAKTALYQERFIDKTVVLGLQRNLSQTESEKEQLAGLINENLSRIAELRIRTKSLYEDYTKKAAADLGEVNQKILDIKERLRPRMDAQERLEVVAPVGGEVMALRVHSTGQVLAPGAAILEIVPDNEPLIIECRIMTDDIAEIHRGLSADVQLAAFNSRTNPKIRGEVSYISVDREEERTAHGVQSFYLAHVVLDRQDLEKSGLYVSPGMPVVAFINIEPRTVLSSVIDPLRHGIDRALRED